MSEQVKLSAGARADIRRDAERNCEGATVADTLRMLDDYDALAQRCRELEAEAERAGAVFLNKNAECLRLRATLTAARDKLGPAVRNGHPALIQQAAADILAMLEAACK